MLLDRGPLPNDKIISAPQYLPSRRLYDHQGKDGDQTGGYAVLEVFITLAIFQKPLSFAIICIGKQLNLRFVRISMKEVMRC